MAVSFLFLCSDASSSHSHTYLLFKLVRIVFTLNYLSALFLWIKTLHKTCSCFVLLILCRIVEQQSQSYCLNVSETSSSVFKFLGATLSRTPTRARNDRSDCCMRIRHSHMPRCSDRYDSRASFLDKSKWIAELKIKQSEWYVQSDCRIVCIITKVRNNSYEIM